MYCENCGTKISGTGNYCSGCGSAVHSHAANSQIPHPHAGHSQIPHPHAASPYSTNQQASNHQQQHMNSRKISTNARTDQKDKATFIILGLLLGGLGIHNFYAGYTGKGVAQLMISVLGFWLVFPLIIVGIWVLVEICTIREDAEGKPFR